MTSPRDSQLFTGMNDNEYSSAIAHITSGERTYIKNQIILSAGDTTHSTGLVLSGSVTIETNDQWGNTTLLGMMKEGDLFAVTYALLGAPLLVDVRANEECRVLFLNVHSLTGTDSYMTKLIRNLLNITARKNLHLSERSFINANRSIRHKVMSYLHSISLREHSDTITIPFDRQQMADYLNIDRSALSKELCAMRDKGIIEFRRNKFILKRGDLS